MKYSRELEINNLAKVFKKYDFFNDEKIIDESNSVLLDVYAALSSNTKDKMLNSPFLRIESKVNKVNTVNTEKEENVMNEHNNRLTIEDGDEKYNADLVATYEEFMNVPAEQRITSYFGDYSIHSFKIGVTEEQIEPIYQKALAAIHMSREEFNAQSNRFVHRSEIAKQMRESAVEFEDASEENKTLYYVSTNAYDFLMTDDGETRRILSNEYGQCPKDENGDYIDIKGFMAKAEDDSSWDEYSESAEQLIGDGKVVAEIPFDSGTVNIEAMDRKLASREKGGETKAEVEMYDEPDM